MSTKTTPNSTFFLRGGGAMGQFVRDKDWEQTSLGPSESWPQSLKTTLSILLNSRFPMFLWWGPDLLCFYNDAYRPSLGQNGKHPSILGMPALQAWPEIWETIKPLIDQVFAGGEATWHENQLIPIFRNGNIEDVYWTSSYSPVEDESGKVAGVLVTCSETTDAVNRLRQLEESKDQLSFAIEATELGTFDYDPNTNRFTANDRLKEWFGLPPKASIKLDDALNAIIPQDRQRVAEAIQKALEYSSGGNYDMEYTIIHPDTKKETIVKARGRAWFDDTKTACRFNGTLQDVTAQALARKKLEEGEASFRLLADSMPQFVWSGDQDGNLNYFNQSVYQYSGLSLEVVNQQGWLQIVHPDDKDANLRTWLYAIRTGQNFSFEHRFRRYDGSYRWQLSRALPLKDAEGTIQMWVGTSTDIHDQKEFTNELEKVVQERTAELKQKNANLEKMNKELQAFTYISSHDLQEPLRKIQTFASHILEKERRNLSKTGQEYLTRMNDSASRMQLLINDLLTYSRTTTTERKFENTLLNDILSEVKKDLREEIQQKNAVIEATNLCRASVIPFQFHQLFFNLISNSLKFSRTSPAPHITITCELAEGRHLKNDQLDAATHYQHLCFADNGIGFKQKYGERIFEVFQRLNGKNEYKGTGIGLAIVKKIIENHRGVIVATGHPQAGATFDIYLPQN